MPTNPPEPAAGVLSGTGRDQPPAGPVVGAAAPSGATASSGRRPSGRPGAAALLLLRSPLLVAASLVGASTALSWLLVLDAWSPVTALPAAVLAGAGVAVVAWYAERDLVVGRAELVATVLLWLLVVAWVVLNVPYVSEYLFVGRDPTVYTLTGLWLVDGPGVTVPVGSGSGGSLGFQESGGVVYPQANHAAPAVAAVVGMVVGPAGVLGANLLVGGAVLLAVRSVAARLAGPWWSLLPVVALAFSLPFLYATRGLYSEPLGSVTLLVGLAGGLHAWRHDRTAGWLLLGLGVGASATTRVDAVAVLIGLLPLLAYRGLHLRRGAARFRPLALVVGSAAPGVTAGRLDLQVNSPLYLSDLAAEADLLWSAVAAALVLSVLLLLLPGGARTALAGVLQGRRFVVLVPGTLLVGLAVLTSRPLWYTDREDDPQPFVVGLQQQAGAPVDATQRYAELSVDWLSWYHGWTAVVLGGVALCLMLWAGLARPGRGEVLLLVAVVLPTLLLYLVQPGIFPDQVWASRRYVVVAVPGLLLAGTWLLARAWRDADGSARTVLLAVGAAVLVAPVSTLPGLAKVVEGGGSVELAGRLCSAVDGRPAVVTGSDGVVGTLRLLCGTEVVVLPPVPEGEAVTAEQLREAAARLGGDAVLVTVAPGSVWAPEAQPAPTVVGETTRWERTLLHAPRVGLRETASFWVVPVDDVVG